MFELFKKCHGLYILAHTYMGNFIRPTHDLRYYATKNLFSVEKEFALKVKVSCL